MYMQISYPNTLLLNPIINTNKFGNVYYPHKLAS